MRKEIIRCCVSGANAWVCVPGDQNIIDWTDKCIDPMGMVWLKDLLARKPKPTNSWPGLTYMLPPLGPSVRLLRPVRADRCGIFFRHRAGTNELISTPNRPGRARQLHSLLIWRSIHCNHTQENPFERRCHSQIEYVPSTCLGQNCKSKSRLRFQRPIPRQIPARPYQRNACKLSFDQRELGRHTRQRPPQCRSLWK
jgi:hypothetical protein